MESSSDPYLNGTPSIPSKVFRNHHFPPPIDGDSVFSSSVKIVKPLSLLPQGPYISESHDYQTINRQKFSRLDYAPQSSSQPSNEVGQILNVQYKARKKAYPHDSPVPAFGAPQKCSSSLGVSSKANLHNSIKPKTLIVKEIQDIVADHNAQLQYPEQIKRAHDCHYDEEVSKEEVRAFFSDELTSFDGGSFGTVFESSKNSSLVLKMTDKPMNVNEILVPLSLKGCQNILQTYALRVSGRKFCIVQQNCGKSLKALVQQDHFKDYIKDRSNCHRFIQGLFKGVEHLEKTKACHGDLKLENICARFENGVYVPRLVDFGTCQASSDKPFLEGTSPEFLPPRVNLFTLKVLKKLVDPNEQGMLLFNEKADSWSVAMVTICLLEEGKHPIKEVQSYNKPGIPERIAAMNVIAQLTDEDIDNFMPVGMDPVTKDAVRNNLRINASERWGASKTVQHLRMAMLHQEGSTSSEIDFSLKRGKKRPVSPFHSAAAKSRSEDDMTELLTFFKSIQEKPPDEANAFKSETLGIIPVNPTLSGIKSPGHEVPAQAPETGRKVISTLKFKPSQQAQEGSRVPKKEALYPDDAPPSGFPPSNIPDMRKLEECQANGRDCMRVKVASRKVVPLEEDNHVTAANPQPIPDFDLLGLGWDMNELPAERSIARTVRRRSTKSKMK